MYHCHIRFYLSGRQHGIREIIKKMPPLGHFTHEFYESDTPQPALTADADVILADITGTDTRKHLISCFPVKARIPPLYSLQIKNRLHPWQTVLIKLMTYGHFQ